MSDKAKTFKLDKYTEARVDGDTIWFKYHRQPLWRRFLMLFGFFKNKWMRLCAIDDKLYLNGKEIRAELKPIKEG